MPEQIASHHGVPGHAAPPSRASSRNDREPPRVSLGDRTVASLLLILASPVLLLLCLAVWATLGWPVFYRGERLGVHKRPFQMIKFRSLPVNAQASIGAQLFNNSDGRIPAFAQFMRETRLDELPQLLNVARGEMALLGPRPEREEIYEALCRDIPGYEERFRVPPGLIGVAQLCTPHSTPKKIRARIDRRYIEHGIPGGSFGFTAYAAWNLVRRLLSFARLYVWKLLFMPVLHDGRERRILDRIPQRDARVELRDSETGQLFADGRVLDMNHDHMRIRVSRRLEESMAYCCRLNKHTDFGGRKRDKTAYCIAHHAQELAKQRNGAWEYLLTFEPTSPLNLYMIDQYFLSKAIISRPT